MATKIKILNLPEGFQSIITNGKHSIIGDEPLASNGTDLGLSPSELVLSGLALCKVATIRHIARKKGWPISNVEAFLVQEVKRELTGLKTNVKIDVKIDGELNDEQLTELLKQADNCYIHRLINGEWDIDKSKLLQEELVAQ
jgi:putative redox protein